MKSARILHTAEILFPMGHQNPIHDAGVIVDETGTVLEVGNHSELPDADVRHYHQILMPGVVNAHVHLTDAGRTVPVPGGKGLVAWVGELLAERREQQDVTVAAARTLDEMRRLGTVAVGEVCNDYSTFSAIQASGLHCRFIHELIGFSEDVADTLMERARKAGEEAEWSAETAHAFGAHAPYSVSPQLMLQLRNASREAGTFLYQHLAEDPDERLLYEQGKGGWRDFLERIGAWDAAWNPPGVSPIPFYDRLGLLDNRFVAVHLADASEEEIALLGKRGVRAILSPTSNRYIGGRLPSVAMMVRHGVPFAFGTDGRGSNPGIDVFGEAALLLEHQPELSPGLLLHALTTVGAGILQFPRLGNVSIGARPGLIAVEVDEITDTPGRLEREIIVNPRQRISVA